LGVSAYRNKYDKESYFSIFHFCIYLPVGVVGVFVFLIYFFSLPNFQVAIYKKFITNMKEVVSANDVYKQIALAQIGTEILYCFSLKQ